MIDISSLLKAQSNFEKFRKNLNTEQEIAGAIQAFEYCYELAWKTMKRLLEEKGKLVNTPRDAFREAALNMMTNDPEIWFNFIKIRNITIHTYDESAVKKVVASFDAFSNELGLFIRNINA